MVAEDLRSMVAEDLRSMVAEDLRNLGAGAGVGALRRPLWIVVGGIF